MQFTINEAKDTLSFTTQNNVSVKIEFDDIDPVYIHLDEVKIDTLSDVVYGIFVAYKGEYVSLKAIIDDADLQFESICEEAIAEDNREGLEYNDHPREMSSQKRYV